VFVCDPEATLYKYLASIKIKATPATIRTHKPEYEIRTGAGRLFVASLRLPSWAVRRGYDAPPSWPNARESVAPGPAVFVIGWGNPMRERCRTGTIAASLPIIALTVTCWGSVFVAVIWLAYRL
jgi:hypothetical protein